MARAAAALLATLAWTGEAAAIEREERARYDALHAAGKWPYAVPRETARARERLGRSLGTQGVVDVDPHTRQPRAIARLDGFLTARSAVDPVDIALDYVRAHADVYALEPGDLDRLRLSRRYTSRNGITHLTWEHVERGIPLVGAGLRANVARDGRLINVLGGARPGLRANTVTPALAAGEALAAARRAVGAPLGAVPRATTARGPERVTRFAGGDSARLVLYDRGGTATRLAWRLTVTASSNEVYDTIVDAVSGALLRRENLVRRLSMGLAWETYPGAPALPRDFAPYLTTGSHLEGDYAHVFADLDDDDRAGPGEDVAPDAAGDWSYVFTPVAAPAGACPTTGCSWNRGVPNSWQANLKQNATQAFWFVNRFHDHLRDSGAGFDAASGAFEGARRLSVQTLDGAAVAAGLPDGAHLNNANFTPATAGRPARIQMYLWGGNGYADVNGGDDAGIVYHEYAHGLSTTLVTDAGGAPALQTVQAGAMGEGWSDYYALDFLVSEGLVPDGPAVGDLFLGAYVDGGRGLVRRQAIDCTVGSPGTNCPGPPGAGSGGFTYDDFGRIAAGGPEVHDDGEIWGQTLWDLRSRVGADRALGLITEAMRLSPPEPSFLDMRNAIVQADTALHAGADRAAIWAVFARRGMGFFASAVDGDDRDPVADFRTPPPAGGPTGTLSGTLTDQDGATPVSGGQAYLGGHFSLFADDLADGSANGSYSIAGIPTGTYPHLVVDAPGYRRRIVRDVAVAAGANTRDVELRRNWADVGAGAALTPPLNPADWPYGCSPADALDGSQRTAFSASKAPVPTVTLELPDAVDVTGFGVDPGAGCGDDDTASTGSMTIQVSENGSSFDTVATPTFGPGDNHRLVDVEPDSSAWGVRYVRFRLNAPQGEVGSQRGTSWHRFVDLSEFQVYASLNQRPVAAFTFGPEEPQTGDTVSFDATSSTDEDGQVERYEWDLDGDGRYETDGATVSHSYAHPGPVTVGLRVTDDRGDTGTRTELVLVAAGAQISDLGVRNYAGGINRYGVVAGNSESGLALGAWRYEAGGFAALGALGGSAVAYQLNNDGALVGWADPPGEAETRAVSWAAGSTAATDLGTLPGEDVLSIARGINGAGTIVGEGEREVEDEDGDPVKVLRAIRWAGGPADLGTLHEEPDDPGSRSAAYDVNNFGQIVGWATAGDGSPQRAVTWNGGRATDLGTLGGRESHADAISDFGEIVGHAETGTFSQRPFLWANGRMRSLGSLGGSLGGARDISPSGELIVGWATDANGAQRAFVHRDAELAELNRYLPAKSGWANLAVANGVNDAAQIVGYGTRSDGAEHAFLLDLGDCEICVDRVELEQRDVGTGDWVPVTADGTVDGNLVRVTAKLKNTGTESQAMNVKFVDVETGDELPDSRAFEALDPGEEVEVVHEWDTEGLAWRDGEPVAFRPVEVTLTVGSTVFDSRAKAMRIAPKPIVAVHGLNSTADTWSPYHDFAQAAHPNWRVFAVGDGQAGGGAMDTGSLTRPHASPNTLYENAEILAEYLERARRLTGAQQVDLVAHSMGGLISRQYIAGPMPAPAGGDPVVANLVMMGTPNAGSPCADLFALPATYELRPDVVAEFNGYVTERHGIPFSVAAGDPMSFTCQEPGPGDVVVAVPSAQHGIADTARFPILHTDMTGSRALFDDWVVPHLVPGADAPAAPRRVSSAQQAAADRQLLVHRSVSVPAGQSRQVDLPVPAGAGELGVAHSAPSAVSSTLTDPGGAQRGSVAAGSSQARAPYRVLRAESPATGVWRLTLHNSGGETATVPVSAWVPQPQLTLTAAAGQPAADGRTPIVADLRDAGAGVAGATMTAELRSLSGLRRTLTLFDDGAHGDGAAGDGRYAATSGVLVPGPWLVAVQAEGSGFSRAAVTRVVLPPRRAGDPGSILFSRTDPETFESSTWIMRPDGSGARPLPGVGSEPAVSPDGDEVAYVVTREDDGTDIWIARLDGAGSPRRLTNDPEEDASPAWSPDGRRLAYSRAVQRAVEPPDSVARGIWVIGADGAGARQLSTSQDCSRCNPRNWRIVDSRPSWSPDGEEIAFVEFSRSSTLSLYVMSVEETSPGRRDMRRLAGSHMVDGAPRWSPDGSRIAFAGSDWSGQGVHVVRPDGGGLRTVIGAERCPVDEGGGPPPPQPEGCGRSFGNPSWSPDGTRLAFDADGEQDDRAIYVARMTGASGVAQITSGAEARVLDWSTYALPLAGDNEAPVCSASSSAVEHDTATRVALFCSDPNGDALALELVDGPQHGTLGEIDQGSASVVYRPAKGYSGPDSFRVRASDGSLRSAAATVSLTVAAAPPPPDPPTGGGLGTGTVGSGSSGGGGSSDDDKPLPRTSGNGQCSAATLICTTPVTCPPGAPASCNGDISNGGGGRPATATVSGRAAAKRARPIVRRTRFRVAPGTTKKVRLRLTRHGRRLVRQKRRVKVTVVIRVRVGTGAYERTQRRMTLRVRKPRRAAAPAAAAAAAARESARLAAGR